MKKGLSSNSFPKTFSIKFSPVRALSVLLLIFTSCVERPVGAKFSYKVFGKRGLGGKEPFLRKVFSPIITYELLYKYYSYGSAFCLTQGFGI